MNTKILSGELFCGMIKCGAANLNRGRAIVNDLNVFPIPDGDTGDNMYMTVNSGASVRADENDGLGDVAAKAANGMLLGARGNSGVILSRIFAGISKGLSGCVDADAEIIAKAFECGIKESYGAVSNPVEGTILTVFREAVEFANSRVDPESTLEYYFDDLLDEMRRSLDRTPDKLAVLKEAGVIDSGGAGLIYITEGMRNALDGIMPEDDTGDVQTSAKCVDISSFDENSVLEFGYCTEFLLRLQNSKIDVGSFDENEIYDYLNSVGESVVAFRDGSMIKVHVHTMTPGEILNKCQQYGEFLTLKIENMSLQHNETTIRNNYTPPVRRAHKSYGVVTVASGEGICSTFESLGADYVVGGGQSMNPSAEDFIKAFDSVDADTILVFPNNGNIIMTANQAAEMYGKSDIRVIPSKTIGEGYAAISMLDTSSGDTDAIVEEMTEVISGVITGMVSRANRDTQKDGVEVRGGDFIGFAHDKIYCDEKDRNKAASELAEKLNAGRYDIILLICGADTTDAESRELYKTLSDAYRRTEVIMINGGQPIYDYIMILE